MIDGGRLFLLLVLADPISLCHPLVRPSSPSFLPGYLLLSPGKSWEPRQGKLLQTRPFPPGPAACSFKCATKAPLSKKGLAPGTGLSLALGWSSVDAVTGTKARPLENAPKLVLRASEKVSRHLEESGRIREIGNRRFIRVCNGAL